jgi:hypothetical protein
MIKFYIESGNFRREVLHNDYLEAINIALRTLAKDQMSGKELHIRLGPSIAINDLGYPLDILGKNVVDWMDPKVLAERKKRYRTVSTLKGKIEYKIGYTFFLPTKQIIDKLQI